MIELNARRIAETILNGFDRHYRIFLEITAAARDRFEACDWPAQRQSASDRINLYTQRVGEATEQLKKEFDLADEVDQELWREVKLRYIGLLYEHKQPELAETFYNSVFTYLFHRRYYNNDNIFVRPGLSTEYLDDVDPVYDSYYPIRHGQTRSVREILKAFPGSLPFEDLNRDVRRLVRSARATRLPEKALRRDFHLQVLRAPFYRNKAAYIVGRAINGADVIPFVIPVLNNEHGAVYVDTLLMDGDDIANLFSVARAYFMVETDTPAAVVHFLKRMLPTKNKADLYAAVVLDKIDLMGEEIRSQIARGTSPKEKVQLCYWARIELFWEYPRFFRLLFNDLRAMIPGSRAGFIEEIMSRYAVFLRELDQLFAEGVEAGQFREVRASTLTLLFEGMIGAYNERMCKLETPVRERNVEEDLLTLFLEGATTH